MYCDNCGSPVDRADAERGTCTHCGAALAHLLRAAEKAELVRRVVAEGGSVRIEGDRIEAVGGPRDARVAAPLSGAPAALAMSLALGAFTLLLGTAIYAISSRSRSPAQPAPLPTPVRASPPSDVPVATPLVVASAASAVAEPDPKPNNPAPRAARPSTVESVIAAHHAQYLKCQRDELLRNPSAPQRYALAMTVSANGRAEWVEVLSEVSPEMKACLQGVTSHLEFPKPNEGSTRSLVTLKLMEHP